MAVGSYVIGYELPEAEDTPGIWTPSGIEEKRHKSKVLRSNVNNITRDEVIDDLNIDNQISITIDTFVSSNMHRIKYVVVHGSKWKVKTISIARPNLILTLGGVYNE